MILTATLTPKCFQKVFKCLTLISLQVPTATNVVFVGKEQSEVTAPVSAGVADGLQLTKANTSDPGNQPFQTWWQGELWYRASAVPTNLVIVIQTDDSQEIDRPRKGGK